MSDLVTDPLFLFGIVVVVAGIAGAAVKAFGVEIGAVTPARSAVLAVVGFAIMAGAWWAADATQFEVTGASIRWRNAAALSCDSVQAFEGAIETTGDPRPVTYRVVADDTVLVENTFTPADRGRAPISSQVRVHGLGPGLPDLGVQGLGLYVEILAPESLRSNVSTLAALPECGALLAEPFGH